MSYNGSGTYVPPAGQPVATGTVISSATFNTLVTDIGNTFNNVLPRDGQASMAGQLKIIDGTSSVPGIAFNSEASSGVFRPASGMLALVAAGVEGIRINSSGRVLIGTSVDDATNKLQVTGPVKVTGAVTATSFVGPVTGAVTGSVTGTAANVTGVVAIANGGTGVTTAAAATTALGAVQQGGGIGQGVNKIYLGWGSGGGMKVTVDSSDQGYLPFSTTNPVAGTVTLASNLSVPSVFATAGAFSGSVSINGGLNLAGGAVTSIVPIAITSGNVNALTTGGGFLQVGGTAGNNVIHDYNSIQARINGAAGTLYLQQNGGNVALGNNSTMSVNGAINVVGNGSITTTGNITANTNGLITGGSLVSQTTSNLKIQMFDGATIRGYISADSGNCFRTINANNSQYTLSVDNGGNVNCTGALTVGAGGSFRAPLSMTDAGGTYRQLLGIGGDNYTNMYVAGGNQFRVLNQAGSAACMTVNNTGEVTINGASQCLTLNQSNGQTQKITLLDNGTLRGYLGADSGSCFTVANTSASVVMYCDNSGNLTCIGNVAAYSDETLKDDWKDVPVDLVNQLRSVKHGSYVRKDLDDRTRHVGVSAQDMQKIMPEFVTTNENGILAMNYGNAAMVSVIELAKMVVDLTARLSKLEEAK